MKEIDLMIRSVKQVVHKKQENIFLLGERGIGKSSLASFLRHLSEREYSLIGVHAFQGGVRSVEEMVRRIFERLLKESVEKPWYNKIKDVFGQYIKQVGLFGISVEFDIADRDLRGLVDNFVPALRNVLQKFQDEKKGLLIALDDINGLAASAEFANWYKSIVDEIATSQNQLPLLMMLIGLPERRDAITKLQPSLARVFSVIAIEPLTRDETKEFYYRTFNSVRITVEPDALEFMCTFSGGLPMLVHEIGDAIFWIDSDNRVTMDDAAMGIVSAAEVVGRRHLDPKVYRAIRSPSYQSILKKVAKKPLASQFVKSAVESELSTSEKKVFTNFLHRMKELGVLKGDPHLGRGGYKFQNVLYQLYLSMEGTRITRGKE